MRLLVGCCWLRWWFICFPFCFPFCRCFPFCLCCPFCCCFLFSRQHWHWCVCGVRGCFCFLLCLLCWHRWHWCVCGVLGCFCFRHCLLCRHLWHWCVCGSRGCFCFRHCLRFCLCFGRRCCCALCCLLHCLSCRAPAFFRGRRGLAKVRGSGLGGFENTTGLGYLLQLYISNLINHRPVFVLEPLPGVQTRSPGIKWPDRLLWIKYTPAMFSPRISSGAPGRFQNQPGGGRVYIQMARGLGADIAA